MIHSLMTYCALTLFLLVASCSDSNTPAHDAAAPDSGATDGAPRDGIGAEGVDSASIGDMAVEDGAALIADGAVLADGTISDGAEGLCTPTCSGGMRCLGQACSCIVALHGSSYLRSDGTVYDTSHQKVVEQGATAEPLNELSEIFEGQWHGCALRQDKTVWCWPRSDNGNVAGQLGDGTSSQGTDFQATQVKLDATTPLTNVMHINGVLPQLPGLDDLRSARGRHAVVLGSRTRWRR